MQPTYSMGVLTVHIYSFSYFKNQIPGDEFGHGGGFVFDCRCLPNPGRLEAYRDRTGLQEDVRAYLEREPAVEDYLSSVFRLVDMAAERYQERGFANLSVSFGCTGGQHRSVYCAERMRAYLEQRGHRAVVQHRNLQGHASV